MTWKRVLTGVVLIPAVTALVLWGSTALVAAGFALFILLALLEYFALGTAKGQPGYPMWTAACAIVLVFSQWLAATGRGIQLAGGETLRGAWPRVMPVGLFSVTGAFLLFAAGLIVLSVVAKKSTEEALPAAGISASAFLLVAFPLSFGIRLHGAGPFGPRLLLFAMVIIWAGDTAAYFVGRSIGRLKLAPSLSPKKTWEGTIASFVASLVVGYAARYWIPVSPFHLLMMASLGNIAGQIGDLAESAYKRSAGVKDSGSLLPGHGGILDRIDALILALPVVWYYWSWISGLVE
ncbi:MAG TPA: phosphatidate cytidylyltransferase [Methylomirabilota bacterium]|nr:phosphatidate cytidylyltransferase [Methylomirabilota bacterium]